MQNYRVKGYSGKPVQITHKGTIQWEILDDSGKRQTIKIPESYYVPNSNTRLLSPQHFSQQSNDNFPSKRGTWCATYDDEIVLQWQQRSITKTCKLEKGSSNVGTMWSAPGYKKMTAFCTRTENPEPDYELCQAALVPEHHNEVRISEQPDVVDIMKKDHDYLVENGTIMNEEIAEDLRQEPLTTNFNMDGPPVTEDRY